MSLVVSLLQAVVQLDGEALVLHAGEKPYVVSPQGHVDLATRGLGGDAVLEIVQQLLPEDQRAALDDLGAIQFELPGDPRFPGEQFTIAAVSSDRGVSAEVRRRRATHAERPPADLSGADESSGSTHSEEAGAPRVDGAREPPATVVPIATAQVRSDSRVAAGRHELATLEELLRIAAARGASALYLPSAVRPLLRVDGVIQTVEDAPVFGASDVEALLFTSSMSAGSAEALRAGRPVEWTSEVAGVGRVRCTSFRDHRGPGGVFQLVSARAPTADEIGLTREIQSLAAEAEGLVLVTGGRSSGKRTLTSALVDLINRTRRGHVITIERQVGVVHEALGCFVSQREVHGASADLLAAARTALREDPDILVIENLSGAPLMNLALDAAASGRLVIGTVAAHTAGGAIDRVVDMYPHDARRQLQLTLARQLRGVVAQALVRKVGGGRTAARELMLNTPAVASLLAEGKTSQLPNAIEAGRRHGMAPLNDALVGFVQSHIVDLREAYGAAADRAGFLALLKRRGVDVTPLERDA